MSIQNLFSGILDHRQMKGKRYKIESILALVCVSILSGRKGLMAAFRLGRQLTREQKTALGFCAVYKTPCHATITELLRYLDPSSLSQKLAKILGNKDQQLLHMDGKTLRGSANKEEKAVHCLSIFCNDLNAVLAQTASRGAGHEIEDAIKLLQSIDVKGQIITGDAQFCQKLIVKQITDGGGDCILQVKNNQKQLKNDIETAFKEPIFPPQDICKSNRKRARTG